MTVRSFGEALPECGRPGNRVIDKLLRAKPISEEERLDLSVYIATMLKRVPHRPKKAYALIPATVEDTKQKLPPPARGTRGQTSGFPSRTPNRP